MSTVFAGTVPTGAALAPMGAKRFSAVRLGDVILFLGVMSGSVVMFEPAPYEVLIGVTGICAFALGLSLPRAIAPLFVLISLFNIGGLINLTVPMIEADKARTFVAVSFFLAFTSLFFAATIADAPHRLNLFVRASITAALIAAALGIVGYFFDIDALTRYDRAKGAFKDPNVFGPFLILPLLLLARDLLTRPLLRVWATMIPVLLLLAAIFFSYSRAAWFLAAFGLMALGIVVFLNERRPSQRIRLILIAATGLATIVVLIAFAASIPHISEMLEQRAKLVQDYDGARLGRLARHWIGFLWATELPLGLGPLDFARYFPEDPHNVYLKALLGYGWLGGVAYLTLVLWTLKSLFPLMFKSRPWQPVAQCVWIALFGHMIIGWIIDSDHWRHFFLLWGLAWGMIALEARHRAEHNRQSASLVLSLPR